MMVTDNELKMKGIMILIENLGEVGAEKFLSLISKESFNYTDWQKDLFNGLNFEQLSSAAMRYRNENDKSNKD